MSASGVRLANFVIGGTEKAGTTSVFDYLSMHPEVGASSKKETDFFRRSSGGNTVPDTQLYAEYFERCNPQASIVMEASPGYLGEAAAVAPRMHALIPGAKLLFILRDPVERFYSSYHFHRGKLNLPQELSFEDYVERCILFETESRSPSELGLDDWYLKVLRFGCYSRFLSVFRSFWPPERLKIMFFESLRDDERRFMIELSDFLGINPEFWNEFAFRRSNVTYSSRNKLLHRLAINVNSIAEPLMRTFPGAKRALVSVYKRVNQAREGYDPMSAIARAQLVTFYAPGVEALQREFGLTLPSAWRTCAMEQGIREAQ